MRKSAAKSPWFDPATVRALPGLSGVPTLQGKKKPIVLPPAQATAIPETPVPADTGAGLKQFLLSILGQQPPAPGMSQADVPNVFNAGGYEVTAPTPRQQARAALTSASSKAVGPYDEAVHKAKSQAKFLEALRDLESRSEAPTMDEVQPGQYPTLNMPNAPARPQLQSDPVSGAIAALFGLVDRGNAGGYAAAPMQGALNENDRAYEDAIRQHKDAAEQALQGYNADRAKWGDELNASRMSAKDRFSNALVLAEQKRREGMSRLEAMKGSEDAQGVQELQTKQNGFAQAVAEASGLQSGVDVQDAQARAEYEAQLKAYDDRNKLVNPILDAIQADANLQATNQRAKDAEQGRNSRAAADRSTQMLIQGEIDKRHTMTYRLNLAKAGLMEKDGAIVPDPNAPAKMSQWGRSIIQSHQVSLRGARSLRMKRYTDLADQYRKQNADASKDEVDAWVKTQPDYQMLEAAERQAAVEYNKAMKDYGPSAGASAGSGDPELDALKAQADALKRFSEMAGKAGVK